MLDSLVTIPWADREHAYGPATDVPDLLRALLDPDPKVRSETLHALYGNVFHQGTRFPAAVDVVPFLIELCASEEVPERADLLQYWGRLIMGYFSIQERPCWGDGKQIHHYGEVRTPDVEEATGEYVITLHRVYEESLKGHELACELLTNDDQGVRLGAAWVLACLPTEADASVPELTRQMEVEPSGWVRAAIAFALGELDAAEQLKFVLAEDPFPAARCMAACELARVEPADSLLEPLLEFVTEPIEGYDGIPGAGGKSTGDAAFSISRLPPEVQHKAIPTICDRLGHARSFDTMPLVHALLVAAFPQQRDKLTKLDTLQTQVVTRLVNCEELWSIGNVKRNLEMHGLPRDRRECAELVDMEITEDRALETLRRALTYAHLGGVFLAKARKGILEAIELDATAIDRAPGPDECWLLCAKAFAETDSERALDSYQRAVAINPMLAQRVDPTWHLADLLGEEDSS
ncbi:HEAT repeat domain-containing protein [Aeoliella sp.]|uniref:HEAT repeat domain-containing protein n=1 Tax=Aeoliella sp. TaxID=2795800 RepID=UPI003CCB8F23